MPWSQNGCPCVRSRSGGQGATTSQPVRSLSCCTSSQSHNRTCGSAGGGYARGDALTLCPLSHVGRAMRGLRRGLRTGRPPLPDLLEAHKRKLLVVRRRECLTGKELS